MDDREARVVDLPETLALPRAKRASQHLQPGQVELVHCARLSMAIEMLATREKR